MLRKLKDEQRIVIAAVLGGAALWTVDSLVDAFVFRECTFWESFGGRFTFHELYFRMLFITIFVLSGLVVSRLLKKRREHEEMLQQALLAYDDERTKSASVLQAIPDGISIQSRDFRVLYQNEVHKQMTGEHQGEFCYQAYAKRDSICPGCPVNESFRDGRLHLLEQTRTDHTGTVQIEIQASPLLNAKGEIIAGIEAVRDITERKRLETSLQDQKKLVDSVIENSAVATFVLDPAHKVLIWNKACEQLTGVPASRVIGTDSQWSAFYQEKRPTLADIIIDGDGQDLSRLYQSHSRSQLTDTGLQAEGWYPNLNGKDRYIIFDANPIYDGTGGLVVVIETLQDITERKRSEEQLKLFSEAIKEAMDGVQIVDLKGQILFSNKAAEEIYGFSAAELVGRHVNEMNVDPAFSAREILPVLREKGRWNGELMVRHKDGREFPVWLSTAMVRNDEGAPIAMIGIMRDITERKRAEEVLSESESRFRGAFENAAVGATLVDLTGRFAKVNRRICEMLGYREDELVGKTFSDVTHPDDIQIGLDHMRRMTAGEIEIASFEKRYIRKDGEIIYLIISPSLIRDGQGRPQYFVGLFQDITARKRTEKELRTYREHLEELVRERTRDLLVANERLTEEIAERRRMEEELLRAQKLESLSLLAGGVAHDFNNLLASMMGNISLALLDLPPSSPSRKQLESAERAALRARDLTLQLLTFSRGGTPVMSYSSMEQVIRDTADFSLRGSKVRLAFSFSEDLLPVEVDQVQMAQVINNLIINADQAMPEGGTITITAENTVLRPAELPPLREGNYVRVSIQDQGIGIPKEHLSKIFDPYFTTKQKGSGLGLAITYSVIRNHNGFITVESTPGSGTVFRIYLPSAAERRTAVRQKEQRLYTGKGRILVMDDEEDVRKTTGDMLVRLGYTVAFAEEGNQAVDLYQRAKKAGEPFDLTIMDLTIPGGMGGKDAVRKLLELDPAARVVVSSGYSKDPVLSDFASYGFKGVVAKPFRIKDLSEIVHHTLNHDR